MHLCIVLLPIAGEHRLLQAFLLSMGGTVRPDALWYYDLSDEPVGEPI
ncbi:MAG: hypothetical protein FWE10_05985 [Rikenellaceae bacterium]|nr:hypothetical protein [Rikenellaceae bacterium]